MVTSSSLLRGALPSICCALICLVVLSKPAQVAALPTTGKILTCTGKLVEFPEFISVPNTDQEIEIFQIPQNPNFRWRARGHGAIDFDERTNGPIYPDGTTVNANGDGLIYISGLAGLKIIPGPNGTLAGTMEFVRSTEDGFLYSLIWQFDRCERTKRRIDSREARAWSAQDILDAYITDRNSKITEGKLFAQGDGIKVSQTFESVGVLLIFEDEVQCTAALRDLIRDGLIRKRGQNFFTRSGITRHSVKIFTSIGGAIESPH